MANHWKEIWNQRKPLADGLTGDWAHVFLELKRLNGYDVMGDGIPLDAFLNFNAGLVELLDLAPGKSVYEVGCGAGANMYLMQHEGMIVGGSDYAEGLVETAQRIVLEARELAAMEAADIPTEEKYDAVYSCGVFSYFPDHAYATRVLELPPCEHPALRRAVRGAGAALLPPLLLRRVRGAPQSAPRLPLPRACGVLEQSVCFHCIYVSEIILT